MGPISIETRTERHVDHHVGLVFSCVSPLKLVFPVACSRNLAWLRTVWGDAQHQGRVQIQCRDTALNSAWTVAGWGEGRTLMIQYSSPLWTAI